MSQNKHYLYLILILLIASVVRLWHLELNPAWYSDEGTHIEIARHLLNGKTQYLGITDSYLIAARLPLFEHLLASWFQLVGVGMFSLRVLTSFLGILSVALVYRVIKTASLHGTFALCSTALFAIYPQAVIYSRFGFSYNLLPIFILLGLWGLIRYQQTLNRRHLIVASIIFGLGTISDFIALSFLPSVLLIVFAIRPKHILITMVALIMPFSLYALVELFIHPEIFLHDLTYTLARTGGLPFHLQLENLLKNIQVLVTETWWIPIGFIGFIFLQPRSLRWMIILLVIPPILISGRTVALYNLSAYYMIPFLPFVAIGVSALLVCGIGWIMKQLPINQQITMLLIIGASVLIIGLSLLVDIQRGFVIGIEHFLIDSQEAYQIQYIPVDYTKYNDVIITSPTMAWMFDANVTDFQLSSLSTQVDSVHFPAELYPERFAFDVHYEDASYAIVDNLWRDWGAVHIPAVANMLTDIQANWQIIFQTDTLIIYKNPKT